MYTDFNGTEVIQLETTLAPDSLRNARNEFSEAHQKETIESLFREIEDGSLYLGDWKAGEIEIVGIERIVSNRFWTEVEYRVLFPPRNGSSEPSKGTYRNIIWNAGVNSGSGALCITKEKQIVLLRSFRHAARAWCLELPRGGRLENETSEECAQREAEEECGVVLTADSQTVDLGVNQPDTGIVRQEAHIIALTNIEIHPEKVSRDVGESFMKNVLVSYDEFMNMVRRNEIQDSWVKSAVLSAEALGLL